MSCVTEGFGFAQATAAKGNASSAINFFASAVDHFDVALHEERAIGTNGDGGLGWFGGLFRI